MGSGTLSAKALASYAVANAYSYDARTCRTTGQTFKAKIIDEALDPRKFEVRECVNSEEHPNTIPVILALDITGSMGDACSETAAALGSIVINLYKKFQDIEFCIMGIGDLAYDKAPIQMSQFESDIRIAEAIDKIYVEGGGGGNSYESYTAAWYMGLKRTKLDCFDKQGRKGIIITMGDEPLNPYLPVHNLNYAVNASEQADIETKDLYAEASKKFDIYHISVDSLNTCFKYYEDSIANSFGQLLGSKYKISTINNLAQTIENCITETLQGVETTPVVNSTNKKGEISW